MLNTSRLSVVQFGSVSKKSDDPRFANVVKSWREGENYDIAIVGIPSDLGVKQGGGRTGAGEAPDAIRAQLLRYGTATNIEYNVDLRNLRIADWGNVITTNDIVETHLNAKNAVEEALCRARAVIVLGGGHDLSYPTISALSGFYGMKIGGMNVDAHFDVRPVVGGTITSGTPFWRLLKEGLLPGNKFFEIGAQGHVNAKEHFDFLCNHHSFISFLSDVRRRGVSSVLRSFEEKTFSSEACFVSIDIDSMAHAFAPGSSAPSPDGFFPKEILFIASAVGMYERVRLFEIMEVNPRYDRDGQTARLAANIILEFCAGFAQRQK